MGTGKKEQSRRERQGKTGDGFGNLKVKGENFYRSAKRVKALNVRTHGLAQRNAAGQITQAAVHQSRDVPTARIEPNRKWFTNTRVISQDSLASFRDAVEQSAKDPYQVLLKTNKLPMTLINDGSQLNGLKQHQAKMTIETSPFAEVFGPKASRKRVKIGASSIEDLAGGADKAMDTYQERLEQARLLSGNSNEIEDGGADARPSEHGQVSMNSEPVFDKGQSKRIWVSSSNLDVSPYYLSFFRRLPTPFYRTSCTRSLTPPMSFSTSWTPVTLWELDAAVSRSTSRRRLLTNILSLSSTRSI